MRKVIALILALFLILSPLTAYASDIPSGLAFHISVPVKSSYPVDLKIKGLELKGTIPSGFHFTNVSSGILTIGISSGAGTPYLYILDVRETDAKGHSYAVNFSVPLTFNLIGSLPDNLVWALKDDNGIFRRYNSGTEKSISIIHSGVYVLTKEDNTAPSVTLLMTPDSKGNYDISPDTQIMGTINDNGVGIDPTSIKFLLNGNDFSKYVTINDTPISNIKDAFKFGMFNITLPDNLSGGIYNLFISVSDTFGNKTTKKYILVYNLPVSAPTIIGLSYKDHVVTIKWSKATQGTASIAEYDVLRKGPKDKSFHVVGITKPNVLYFNDKAEYNGTYEYEIQVQDMAGFTAVSDIKQITVKDSGNKNITVKYKYTIIMHPDDPYMIVNGKKQEIDPGRGTKPVIIPKWSRTVVPIRAVVEALQGSVVWYPKERKVAVFLNGTNVNLWINKPQGEVNGETRWIDPNNHDVRPIIINDRTMLPLRFVAESLGCKVLWDGKTRTITILYGEEST